LAIKGQERDTALILSVSKADTGGKRRGLRVWNVSGPVAKMELYRWLKLEWPTLEDLGNGIPMPTGACFFPQYGEEYFKQITAERCVTKIIRGFPKQVWEKDPTRNNEALDCRVYARAAASVYGLDRMSDYKWRRLEAALGIDVKKPTRGIELPVSEDKPETTATTIEKKEIKHRLQQRKVIKADDPYL
jgi:phage terminase large subunit GpA-like protein